MSAYATTLNLSGTPSGESWNRYFSLQHWYPRIWDEWARSRDGAVVDNYGIDEDSIEIQNAAELDMRVKPLVPKFGRENWFRSEGLCVNELNLRMYGTDEHLAEVYPKARGEKLGPRNLWHHRSFRRLADRASRHCEDCPELDD